MWPPADADHLLVGAVSMGAAEQRLFDSGMPVAAWWWRAVITAAHLALRGAMASGCGCV
ncbi:hypothetical protein [Synechococcus sp. MU1642]|uniref:hypothetical protein n=1 Tax=Synechococcus sp. MU1642 TaxID=2508348 RepID=UPI001CF862ED|nr:hypothetical protein [Synechococcus sp. MU1642]